MVASSSDMVLKCEWAFNLYDINEDGTLDRKETRRLVEDVLKMNDIEEWSWRSIGQLWNC